ncbi:MAG: DUF370 domain-containing protein [Candidatus Omnitrophica bacterium]|nr:DUF370 domain-containing protein [Candidatus Omnitrophota bacterium]MBU1925167.1 DUF370 domain-containing protein [Candidatus Omnitrophota bacterium]
MTNKYLINVGFNNVVVFGRIIAVVGADAAPVRRLKEEARKNNKLIDATNGRRTRAVIIVDSDHVILSSIQPETVAQRIEDRNV